MPSSAGMPKLPRHDTKQSATPARIGGVISGSTIVRITLKRARAAGEARLDQLLRQRPKSRAKRQEDERRILDAQHQDDASGRIQRIAAAQRRRGAEHFQERARGSEQLQPRERHHLRREQQRHHETEDERVAMAEIGQRDDERDRAADEDREQRAAEGGRRGCGPSRSRSSALDSTRRSASVDERPAGRDAFEQRGARAAAPTGSRRRRSSHHSSA